MEGRKNYNRNFCTRESGISGAGEANVEVKRTGIGQVVVRETAGTDSLKYVSRYIVIYDKIGAVREAQKFQWWKHKSKRTKSATLCLSLQVD